MTPLQLANAFAALANGGVVHQPYLVRAIGRDERSRSPARRTRWDAPVTPQTAVTLERVLETRGHRRHRPARRGARLPRRRQDRHRREGRSPASATRRRRAWRASSASCRRADPAWSVWCCSTSRAGATHGGDVAAPVFGAVMKQALLYLGVPPDPDLLEDPEQVRSAARPGSAPRRSTRSARTRAAGARPVGRCRRTRSGLDVTGGDMVLEELVSGLPVSWAAGSRPRPGLEVAGVCHDSRRVEPGRPVRDLEGRPLGRRVVRRGGGAPRRGRGAHRSARPGAAPALAGGARAAQRCWRRSRRASTSIPIASC